MRTVQPRAGALAARPLLKWAGGKRQLLPHLRSHYPDRFRRYVEPFFGSGAVFFDLLSARRLDGRQAWLADINADLMGCYQMVREEPEAVIAALRRLESQHRADGAACYYRVRDEQFNPERARSAAYSPARAAMLIYLNRTGFNGLFRLNRQGAFNVPAGRYANPRICDAENIRACAAALRRPGVVLSLASFEQVLAGTGAGDFVYCDPPYAPVSPTARFAHYTAGGFTTLDQHRLRQAVIAAARRGAVVVLSNSSAPEIERGYAGAEARAAGLRVSRVPARRAINSRAAGRGPVDELIVSTVAPRGLEGVRPRMAPARVAPRRRTA
jgi:DNA adenine methylase